ncbi:hypothetical protein PINS_up010164 [Pythium insidiosum]|nr:hypothetical protein PINS_up010164 [Pythium insidiosum]
MQTFAALRTKRAELRYIREQLHELEATITPESLKTFVVSVLELYLSFALILSLFECPDLSRRDEQELQYLYQAAWIPLLWGAVLSFGHKLAPSVAPAPDNIDHNLRVSKLVTWGYSLVFLIVDKDMVLKQGPALQVAVLFCLCDVARFEMEIARLVEDDEDEEDAELERLSDAIMAAEHAQATATAKSPAGDGDPNAPISSAYQGYDATPTNQEPAPGRQRDIV